MVVLQILPWRMQRARQYNLRKHYNATFCLWVKSTHSVYPQSSSHWMQLPRKNPPSAKKAKEERRENLEKLQWWHFSRWEASLLTFTTGFHFFWFLVPMRGEVFIPSDNNNTQHHRLTIVIINLNKCCFSVVTPVILCKQLWKIRKNVNSTYNGEAEQMSA